MLKSGHLHQCKTLVEPNQRSNFVHAIPDPQLHEDENESTDYWQRHRQWHNWYYELRDLLAECTVAKQLFGVELRDSLVIEGIAKFQWPLPYPPIRVAGEVLGDLDVPNRENTISLSEYRRLEQDHQVDGKDDENEQEVHPDHVTDVSHGLWIPQELPT